MSAAGRGAERIEQGFYETPEWLTESVMPVLERYDIRRILEPAVGGGAILRVLWRHYPNAIIDYGDIQTGQNFFSYAYEAVYDCTITNPPFSMALEFMRRPLQLRRTKKSIVVMLARVNFLGSQRRADWLRQHTPSLLVSPKRPSFVNGRTDAT